MNTEFNSENEGVGRGKCNGCSGGTGLGKEWNQEVKALCKKKKWVDANNRGSEYHGSHRTVVFWKIKENRKKSENCKI